MTYKTQLKKRVLAGLLAGTALWLGMPAALAASGAVPNTQLPDGGQFIGGNTVGSIVTSGAQMTITQNEQNAVIQWDKGFNVGANATVNFDYSGTGDFNTLNYDASGNMSQIYGAINAINDNNKGNIYIVNPAGVEISSSAQINVGSLYVSNKKMADEVLNSINDNSNITNLIQSQDANTNADAVLMSLGNINADHVTFEGRRIVIDTERLKYGDDKMGAGSIHVRTTDSGQVVLGYDGYDESSNTYGETKSASELASVKDEKGNAITDLKGYMWVEDIEQLQDVNTNLSGQYALRNSIDATATQDWNDQSATTNPTDVKEGFASIGSDEEGKSFTGKFDGLDYNIFNLNINRNTENNVGLFGVVGDTAVIQNVTLVGGSIKGQNNVGALAGQVQDGAQISNIMNSASVTGSSDVGGIIGSMSGTTVQKAENSGNVTATGYTTGTYTYHSASGIKEETVTIANAGGIAGTASGGSTISDVQNSGDVSSSKKDRNNYYDAGNVGGIAGSAVDTNISDATNEENEVRGAHNVGGIAGYFGSSSDTKGTYKIDHGINSGGNIMATGARNEDNNGFVTEWVRSGSDTSEAFNVGNMGGIAGYLDGDNVYIASSANRGTVHTAEFTGTVPNYAMAANAGGIVGKIDRSHTLGKDGLGTDYASAAVSNSYNTGDVMGYTGVGGVAGMMYNGEIAGSYNLGYISTTRKNGEGQAALNMGGIVGDTTEQAGATAVLYDVYNKGQIGDEGFGYYARHVGGIVGRLSGTVEKAYNTGAIYNGSNAVGGIAGWMYEGSITNSFNTGNITVSNHNDATSQVGGIVGAANLYAGDIDLKNIYNLGTLRSFTNSGSGKNSIGGIIGEIFIYGTTSNPGILKITNAYTLGNIYSRDDYSWDDYDNVHPMLGQNSTPKSGNVIRNNTYYIQPETSNFATLTETDVTSIAYANRHNQKEWGNFSFSTQNDGDVDNGNGQEWRIYDGVSLPILNAFLPHAEEYFSQKGNMSGIDSIQYGTAYDPLLTIINAKTDRDSLTFNWKDLGINNAAGLAVYGANLTLNDFMATGGSGYFGGLIYSDGALVINAHTSEGNTKVTGDVALGSASQLYGSSVSISANGNVTIYGNITATGNTQDGTTRKEGQYSSQDYLKTDGSISVTGGSVDVYGQLTSAKEGETTRVPGINSMADGWTPENVGSSTTAMPDLGGRFGYTTGASAATGSISITATASEDGHVNVYYGHQQKGFLDTAKDLTVEASGDVYMDSDLSIGGNLSITSPGEMILDISNIGKVQKDNGTVTDSLTGLHTFLHHFDNTGGTGKISFAEKTGKAANAKITVDMWDDENNGFNLTQYDSTGHKLVEELNALNFSVSGEETVTAKDYTYIWVSTGEQLAGIQQAAERNSDFLGYNFALKNDIDANMVENYKAIGTGSDNGFTGTFDGRDNRIIGLKVTGDNAGIFDTIGTNGKVEDLRVYSGTFNGTDNAGAVAGINNGTISNVTTFGNVVTAKGSKNSTVVDSEYVGAAGGIAGVNGGTIDNASASDAVTADDAKADDGNGKAILSTAGGIAGINQKDILNSSSNSAVNASAGSTYALGGIAGVNTVNGKLSNVDSLGVTTGIYEVGSHNTAIGTQYSDNVGGIAGRNSGTVSEAYNESIVSGRDNVGGILGVNTEVSVTDVSNAARVTGEAASDDTSDYVGGLVGSNSGSITNGRNNGEITGNQYVGGLVGENGKNSTLSNLVNDEAASITGDNYVGGIAGRNYGTISANDEQLVNRGSITGQMYVGGVAGSNEAGGIIENTISSIALHVKTPDTDDTENPGDPKYFGGVVGQNSGIIKGATNESSVDVAADGATMVGGIIGQNTDTGTLEGTIANEGLVSGKSDVGGIIGSNQNENILNNADKDENGQPNERLVVSNSGRVQAEDGGAAGIFYENTGAINNADLTNTGMVIGGSSANSVTGGLFGTNSDNITNSTLTNTGTVYGGGTVGGLIGKNTGDISTSSLINSVDGKVIGLNNVGGLIGQNYGTITGGRTEKDEQNMDIDVGYYKYQIYNNGTIQVGTWTDSDKDGKIGTNEFTAAAGENIGGLVGLNGSTVVDEVKKTGSITAAYNTGAIMAGSSTNVGGIAGSNTGKLDQVFNTVITGVGTDGSNVYGSITGGTNVGGIVGSNETNSTSGGGIVGADEAGGTVSNAYNTTGVSGNGNVGLIAGNNTSTADNSISNVYSIGAGRDRLIGSDSVDDVVPNGFILSESEAKKSESYTGLGFEDTEDFSKESLGGIWKIYDGSSMALLKVFLTKAKVTDPNLVYNGQEQVIGTNSIEAVYGDVTIPPLGQNSHKDAGNYDDWLYSSQIAASGTEADGTFNPNHLGYDIVYKTNNGKIDIDKAVLTVTGNRVDRTYGSADITSSTDGNGVLIGGNKDYGFTIEAGESTTITDAMKEELTGSNLGFDKDQISDGALSKESGKTTNDVKEDGYTWSTDLTLSDTLKGNYTFAAEDGTNSITATVTGDSHVNKADLAITAGSETIYVGGIPNYTGTVISFVNGDSFQVVFGVEDSSIESVVDTHTDAIGFWYDGSFYTQNTSGLQSLFGGNYNITVIPGTLTVKDLPSGMPDISDSERWNTLLRVAPWDRNGNFRERKAEVHFLAGGMTL